MFLACALGTKDTDTNAALEWAFDYLDVDSNGELSYGGKDLTIEVWHPTVGKSSTCQW